MPLVPDFGFCGPSYLAASPVIDASRAINLYAEPGASGSKSQIALLGRPGLSQTGFALTLPSYPVRALWAGDNRLFAVGGTHFYELKNDATILTDYGVMAGSGNQGPCQIIANGVQLLVCDPSAGQVFFVQDGGPDMLPVFGGLALEYLDGYFIALASIDQAATTQGVSNPNPSQINLSAQGDGTTWPALSYFIRSGSSDRVTQLAQLNGQLWLFGTKTIEVWYNAGLADFPFARMPGATINLGLLSAASVVKFSNTICWLAADDRGYAQVYATKGLTPSKVSNAGIEYLISRQTTDQLARAWAYGYQEAGHTFYVLNFVNSAYVPQASLVYDLSTGLWHERTYAGAWPVSFASVPNFNASGPNFVGDGKSGKIMFQGIGYPADLTAAIHYERTAPHLANSNQWLSHHRFELDGDFGAAQPTLDYSDDGGRTFGGRTRPLQQANSAARGSVSPSFRRFFALQLGRSRDRVYKVSIDSSTDLIRIANAYLEVE